MVDYFQEALLSSFKHTYPVASGNGASGLVFGTFGESTFIRLKM